MYVFNIVFCCKLLFHYFKIWCDNITMIDLIPLLAVIARVNNINFIMQNSNKNTTNYTVILGYTDVFVMYSINWIDYYKDPTLKLNIVY